MIRCLLSINFINCKNVTTLHEIVDNVFNIWKNEHTIWEIIHSDVSSNIQHSTLCERKRGEVIIIYWDIDKKSISIEFIIFNFNRYEEQLKRLQDNIGAEQSEKSLIRKIWE